MGAIWRAARVVEGHGTAAPDQGAHAVEKTISPYASATLKDGEAYEWILLRARHKKETAQHTRGYRTESVVFLSHIRRKRTKCSLFSIGRAQNTAHSFAWSASFLQNVRRNANLPRCLPKCARQSCSAISLSSACALLRYLSCVSLHRKCCPHKSSSSILRALVRLPFLHEPPAPALPGKQRPSQQLCNLLLQCSLLCNFPFFYVSPQLAPPAEQRTSLLVHNLLLLTFACYLPTRAAGPTALVDAVPLFFLLCARLGQLPFLHFPATPALGAQQRPSLLYFSSEKLCVGQIGV